jgi:hypothetical protein
MLDRSNLLEKKCEMGKKLQLLVVFISLGIFLLLASCAPLPPTHDYYVSTSGNDANDCLSAGHACLTVVAAVTKATASSWIHIGPGTFPAHIDLRKWLTISGAGLSGTGTVLIADSTAPVVTIENDVQLTISDLTISGGDISDLSSTMIPTTFGGSNAIELHGNNIVTQLTAKNVNLVNATYGILSAAPASIYLIDTSIFYDRYGISSAGGKLNVSSSMFQHNGQSDLVNASVAVLDDVTDQNSGINLTDPRSEAAIENITSGHLDGSLQISNSTISDSPVMGISSTSNGAVSLSASTLEQNGGNGINILAPAADVTITTSVIESNHGMGVKDDAAETQITQTAIINNLSIGLAPSGTVSVVNTTIAGNHGAGISGDARLTLEYDTIAYNTLSGLTLESSNPTTLYNTIIALNSPTNCSGSDPAFTPVLNSTDLACDDSLTQAGLGLDTTIRANAGTYDIPLLAGSPAIDHASASCPAVDQRGYTRPYGPACDIGAYEFGAGAHLTLATPVTVTPTLAILQIVTNTPTVSAMGTAIPTGQLSPQVIPTLNAFCRKGPGTLYDQVTVLQDGTAYNVIGRNSLNTWWQIQLPGNQSCWVGDSNVGKQGAVDTTLIVLGLPLPGTPAEFVNSFVCNLKLKSLGVAFNWAAVPGVTGYRIYRNGGLLTTVVASQTSYHDNAPLGVNLVYELEAFNDNGMAPRLTASVPACK